MEICVHDDQYRDKRQRFRSFLHFVLTDFRLSYFHSTRHSQTNSRKILEVRDNIVEYNMDAQNPLIRP